MNKQLRLLFWLFKFSFPLSAVSYPLVALFGLFNHWHPATEALESYPGQAPIMVGFSYRSRQSSAGSTTITSRSYALWPSLLRDPKVITIRQVDELAPVVSKSDNGFIYIAVWYVISIFGTWWFWFRRNIKSAAQQNASEDALKQRASER
jgi:hypothetical protein